MKRLQNDRMLCEESKNDQQKKSLNAIFKAQKKKIKIF
jgi:hypothetical protein